MSQKRVQFNKFEYVPTPKTLKWITKALTYRFNIAEGTIRSGKDTMGSVAFIERILTSKETLFLVAATSVDRGMSIVGRYINDYFNTEYHDVGCIYKTKYNNTDALAVEYKKITKYIIFAGGYNKNSQDFIQGLSLGGVYLTEINLLNLDFITQCQKRIAAAEGGFIIGTLNPKGPSHWFYEQCLRIWYEEQKESPEDEWLNFNRFELADNPVMTAKMIRDAKKGYDPNSVLYKRDILGQRVDAEGLVYKLYDYNYIEDFNPNDYINYKISVDPGETVSATSITLGALRRGFKGVDILKEYYHRNADNENRLKQKSNTEYAKDVATFVLEAIDIFDKLPECVILDNGAAFYKDVKAEFDKNRILRNISIKYPIKVEIEERIKRSSSLIYKGRVRFRNKCKETIQSFKSVTYDDKKLLQGKSVYLDKPEEGTRVDPVDSVCYLLTSYDNDLLRVNYDINDELGG